MPKPTKHAQYLNVIQHAVGQLVAAGRHRALEFAMETTGYMNNRSSSTSAELGKAIVALAGIADGPTLRGIVSAVVFEYHMRRSNNGHADGDWTNATAMAEFALLYPEMVTFPSRNAKRAA